MYINMYVYLCVYIPVCIYIYIYCDGKLTKIP